MTRQRSSHEQKTLDERRRYIETTIRGTRGPTPTVYEREGGFDSTVNTSAEGLEPTRALRPTRKKSAPNPIIVQIREHWMKVVAGAVLIPLSGWALHSLYSLNREVGVIQTKVDGTAMAQEQLRNDFARLQDQTRQELDRLNDRLDRTAQRH